MNALLSLISKYSGYFHDGSVHLIYHDQDSMIISMESAQVLSEWDWNRKLAPLSKHDTISGKLHINHIKSIKKNNCIFHDTLAMIYDHGDLYELEIKKNKVKILITWEQYLPIKARTDMYCIEIEAEKIYWENIPNLFDKQ